MQVVWRCCLRAPDLILLSLFLRRRGSDDLQLLVLLLRLAVLFEDLGLICLHEAAGGCQPVFDAAHRCRYSGLD